MKSWQHHHDVVTNETDDNTQLFSNTVTATATDSATATATATSATAAAAADADDGTDDVINRLSTSARSFVDLNGEDEIKIELQSPLLDDDSDEGYNLDFENTEDSSPLIINDTTVLEKDRLIAVPESRDIKQSWARVVSTAWPDEGRRGQHRHDEEYCRNSVSVRLSDRSVIETSLMESLLSNSSSLEKIEDPYYHSHYSSMSMPLFGEEQRRRTSICAVFLRDFEQSRPCSLPPNVDGITSVQLVVHKIRFSILWQLCVSAAVCYLFISSYFEGHAIGAPASPVALLVLTIIVDVIFALDMIMKRIYSGYDRDSGSITHTDRTANIMSNSQHNPNVRKARNRWWNIPMVWLLLALSCETTIKFWVNQLHPDDRGVDLCIWSGALKPIVFFYVSSKAQDAISALSQVASIVSRVIIMELFIILCFAAVACHLYSSFDTFTDLPNSFRSLFELSTTAMTPSLWIPVYNEDRSSVLFFVPFIICCVFYLHSIGEMSRCCQKNT